MAQYWVNYLKRNQALNMVWKPNNGVLSTGKCGWCKV